MPKLGDLVTIRKGKKPPRTSTVPSEGAFPLILTPNLKGAPILTFCLEFKGQVEATKQDVLITWDGSVGTTFCGLEGIVGSTLAILRVKEPEKLLPRYFAHFLRTKEDSIRQNSRGASIPHVDPEHLSALVLEIPDMNSQKRVVEILDSIDLRIQARHKQLLLLAELETTLFQETLATGGSVGKLGELGKVTTGKTPPTANAALFQGNIPFITPGDLNSAKPPARWVSAEGAKLSRIVRAGSTLVCCIGATIGKTDQAAFECSFNQQINAIEWGPRVRDIYGLFAVRNIKSKIISSGSSTTLPLIPKSRFVELEITVPELDIQDAFCQVACKTHEMSNLVRASLKADEELMLALQRQYFYGGVND